MKRYCRICGRPEKKAYWGYSNLTPYSQICVQCVNRELRKAERRETTWDLPPFIGPATKPGRKDLDGTIIAPKKAKGQGR